jgi:hypothetical protein
MSKLRQVGQSAELLEARARSLAILVGLGHPPSCVRETRSRDYATSLLATRSAYQHCDSFADCSLDAADS